MEVRVSGPISLVPFHSLSEILMNNTMKYMNIVLYAVLIAVAIFVAEQVDVLAGKIPLLRIPFGGFQDMGLDEMARDGFAFWLPVCSFLWNLAQLVLPAGVGILILYLGEKGLFQRRATVQKAIAPIWFLVAVVIAMIGCPTYFQRGFIFSTTIGFGVYSLIYQIYLVTSANKRNAPSFEERTV